MKRSKWKKWSFRCLGALLIGSLLSYYLLPWFWSLSQGLNAQEESLVLLDRNGESLRVQVLEDSTRRVNIEFSDIPEDFLQSTLAAEDKRFFQHGGVDFIALGRAMSDWIKTGRPSSGASTITQQLVKLNRPQGPRTLQAKFHEMMIARRLEMSWSKEDIFTAYINCLSYGNRRSGPVAAAQYYFNKSLENLSLAESAFLAGLPQAPSRLNPRKDPSLALQRRDTILHRLKSSFELGKRVDVALDEDLQLSLRSPRDVAPWLSHEMSGSGSIQTTLDASLQRRLETIVQEELEGLKSKNVQHAAAIVADVKTGDILALVSSGDWNNPNGGQIDGTRSKRSPGSALKPFTYLLSIEKSGKSTGSIVVDIPTRYRTAEGLETPENFDKTFRGPVTIRHALACSLNVPAMKELQELGGANVLLELLKTVGMTSLPQSAEDYGLGLTIGNAPVSLRELITGYRALARLGESGGLRLRPHEISEGHRVFTKESAYMIADILADPDARRAAFGRNSALDLPFRCAVKTGTSSDFRDNWCVGYTPDRIVAVWVGNFDNTPMDHVSGVSGAGPIFHRAMIEAHESTAPRWFERPLEVMDVTVDPRTGRMNPHEGALASQELCLKESPPTISLRLDYDDSGRVLLDANYTEWLASDHNRRRQEFAPRADKFSQEPLRIIAPVTGQTYLLDPDLPKTGRLTLQTHPSGLANWQSDTLEIVKDSSTATLIPGKHTLTATDSRSGETHTVTIEVREL